MSDLSSVAPEYYRPSPLWMSAVTVAVCLLALVALIVIVVVCLVRARARHKLCWTKHRCYLPVPLFYQNGSRAAAATTVVVDPVTSTTTTIVSTTGCTPADGPELAPLTCV